VALFKAGVTIDPPDFSKILSRPELLSGYLPLDDFKDCLEGYQDNIDDEERRAVSPAKGFVVRVVSFALCVGYWFANTLNPGNSVVTEANLRNYRKLGAFSGVQGTIIYACGFVAYANNIGGGSISLAVATHAAYYNLIFILPWALASTQHKFWRTGSRSAYFDRCMLRYLPVHVAGIVAYGGDIMDEMSGIMELEVGGWKNLPNHFAVQELNKRRQASKKQRKSVTRATLRINKSGNVRLKSRSRTAFYLICASIPLLGIIGPRMLGSATDNGSLRIALEVQTRINPYSPCPPPNSLTRARLHSLRSLALRFSLR
jgi:hypothetical protein